MGTPDVLPFKVTNLQNGTQYDVQVRAVNAAGEGDWSPTSVGTPRTVPGPPTVDSVSGASRELTVGWSAPASDGGADPTAYDLRYIEASADETVDANWTVELAVWTSGSLQHTISSLEVGTRYDVQVRAVNEAGEGSWSATRMGTTALSDDATLSSLALSGATLYPTFASQTTAYTASTGYLDQRTTVAATTTDPNVSVDFLDGSNNQLTDAHSADGFQVNLSVGENVIQVRVTAQDTVTTETYEVTVERAAQDTSLTPPASDPVATGSASALYTVTFQGRWNTDATTGGVPGGAHFSPLIGGVHSAGATFLKSGEAASAGVESMAEVGGTSGLRSEVNAAINSTPSTALSVLSRSGNIGRVGQKTLNNVRLTTEFPRVTLTTMIAPSHDWFVGVSGLLLLDSQGEWRSSHTVDLFPWDAGTEEGTDFSLSPSVDTVPRGVITSISGTGRFSAQPIASLTFTRQSVSPSFPPSETGARSVAENTEAGQPIGDPVAAGDPDSGDSLRYTLGGPDAGSFSIVGSTGQLQTKAALDHEDRSTYSVTVTATDPSGLTGEVDVTINVTNVDEPGTVSIVPEQPRVGTVLRAKLSDPDGGIRSVTLQWARSSDKSSWTPVAGAGSSYTPADGGRGMYLRVTAAYRDGEGFNKTAEAVPENVVGNQPPGPGLSVKTFVSNLSVPWGIAFTPDGTMLLTQRAGVLSSRLADGTVQAVTADFSDLYARGETGLMGIVADPGFSSNRRFYTCQGHTGPEIHVIAWTINAAYTQATRVADPLVEGIPINSGRHGGCRLRFGPRGYLWIATGDAASGTVPQDLDSLGGKVLRVNASTGAAAPSNPSASRVYTYGHRNVQGLALRPGTNQMWSVEHGPPVDDEINLLTAGGNYGWDPAPGYNESVPMTDLVKFPGAIEAKWSSGNPTLATSGGIFLQGDQWGHWNGHLAVASLKDRTLRVFEFTSNGALVSEVIVSELNATHGRLRTPMLDPDGALYVSTSNGSGDRVLRVTPHQAPAFPTNTDTQEVAENSSPATIVATVTATDWNHDTLSYSLSGDDAASFTIPDTSVGELRASVELDHETRDSYQVIVTATDPGGLSDSIRLTINVSDVNEVPEFPSSRAVSRNVPENSGEGTNIGAPVSAADPEKDTLTYTLGGPDAGAFRIVSSTGQLRTEAALDHEDKSSYSVTVSVRDGRDPNGNTDTAADDSISVTVTVSNEEEAGTGPCRRASPRLTPR